MYNEKRERKKSVDGRRLNAWLKGKFFLKFLRSMHEFKSPQPLVGKKHNLQRSYHTSRLLTLVSTQPHRCSDIVCWQLYICFYTFCVPTSRLVHKPFTDWARSLTGPSCTQQLNAKHSRTRLGPDWPKLNLKKYWAQCPMISSTPNFPTW